MLNDLMDHDVSHTSSVQTVSQPVIHPVITESKQRNYQIPSVKRLQDSKALYNLSDKQTHIKQQVLLRS